MTADEVAISAAHEIAGKLNALPATTRAAFDEPALIAEGQLILTRIGNFLPVAMAFLRTIDALWSGLKTGS